MEPSFHTVLVRQLIERYQQGDALAWETLLGRCAQRLERLTRKMLGHFPKLRRHEETGDIFDNAMMRLGRALQEARPADTKEFFSLAAEQIRRVLLDRVRYYRCRPEGHLAAASSAAVVEGPTPRGEDQELERWQAFHEAIAQLPARERETVGLVFYHGWTHVQIADLCGVSKRQVGRWWTKACLLLNELLKGEIPSG